MEFSIVPMECTFTRVMEIERDSFIDPWTEYAFRNEISDNPHAAYFVALVEDRVVAFIGGWLIIDQVIYNQSGCEPRYRQQGIAKALLDAIMAYSWGVKGSEKLHWRSGFPIIQLLVYTRRRVLYLLAFGLVIT